MPSREEASHWRALATDAQLQAQLLTDPDSRMVMVEIARRYELLAQRAERPQPVKVANA